MKATILDRLFNAYIRGKTPAIDYKEGQEMAAGQWYRIGVDSIGSDGTPGNMFFKKGSNRNLLIFFNGGGTAYDEKTAQSPATFTRLLRNQDAAYVPNFGELSEFMLFCQDKEAGLRSNSAINPFHDWNTAIINYGTGDFHLGRTTYSYRDEGREQTVHFAGYDNYQKTMERILRLYPAPQKLLLAGESAGGFGVTALAGDVIERFPTCNDITLCVDSAFAEIPDADRIIKELWNAPPDIAAQVKTSDFEADWLQSLYGRYRDRIKYLFVCGIHDVMLADLAEYGQGPMTEHEKFVRFEQQLRRHIERIKKDNPHIGVYLHRKPNKKGSEGTHHCVMNAGLFFEPLEDATAPCQWMLDGTNGKVYDCGLEESRRGVERK